MGVKGTPQQIQKALHQETKTVLIHGQEVEVKCYKGVDFDKHNKKRKEDLEKMSRQFDV